MIHCTTKGKMNTHTEAKHTPGPWKIEETNTNGAFIDIVSDNGWLVAEIEPNNPEVEANAQVIAQVPAMIEALEYYSRGPWDDGAFAKAVLKTISAQ